MLNLEIYSVNSIILDMDKGSLVPTFLLEI